MDAAGEERWRPVIGYEGLYEVSNFGRIRSLDRVVVNCLGIQQRRPSRILRPTTDRDGYQHLKLARDGAKKDLRVHRLVMEAFVGPCPAGQEVCHEDGDPADNRLVKLRYDTRRNNNMDVVRHGTHAKRQRTHCPRRHRLEGANLHPGDLRRGRRKCLACDRAHTYLRDLRVRRGLSEDLQSVSDRYYAAILASAGSVAVQS